MSIKVMTLVWDSELETTRKFILLYYADRASDEGENVWPAVGTVAKKTGMSERTVQRVTNSMIEEGVLIKDGKSKRGTNKYKINLEYFKGDTVTPRLSRQKGVTLAPSTGDIACHPNHHINHHLTDGNAKNTLPYEDGFFGEKEDDLNAEEYRKRLGNAMLNGFQQNAENPQNDIFQKYPVDVADWCREFSRFSNCEPTPYQKSDWIKGARNCIIAGISKDRIKDVIDQMDREKAKYYRPGSIVLIGQKLVRGNNINLDLRNSK
jgi:hypothetical protein